MVFYLFIRVQELVSPSELLTPGQLVRCVVTSLDVTKGSNVCIKLSINPKDVNKELKSSSLKAGMVRKSEEFPILRYDPLKTFQKEYLSSDTIFKCPQESDLV